MANAQDNKEGPRNDRNGENGAKKAGEALASVSSGIAAMLIQRTLEEGSQIRVPSLDITLKKDKTKSG
jgi:hypothetical protein